MADLCDIYTVAGMTMNAATGDTLIIEDIQGLDGIDTRRTVWPQGQSDGAILGTAKKRERLPIFTGFVHIRTVASPFRDPTGWAAAVDALERAWVAAIDGIENADSTLAWTGDSLTVRKMAKGIEFRKGPQIANVAKPFLLTLIAANPTIA